MKSLNKPLYTPVTLAQRRAISREGRAPRRPQLCQPHEHWRDCSCGRWFPSALYRHPGSLDHAIRKYYWYPRGSHLHAPGPYHAFATKHRRKWGPYHAGLQGGDGPQSLLHPGHGGCLVHALALAAFLGAHKVGSRLAYIRRPEAGGWYTSHIMLTTSDGQYIDSEGATLRPSSWDMHLDEARRVWKRVPDDIDEIDFDEDFVTLLFQHMYQHIRWRPTKETP